MELYLIRHGEATTEEVDPKRPLTEGGREDAAKVAKYLKDSGARIDCIVHSHKLRAIETARIIAETLNPKMPCDAWDGLSPNDPIEGTVTRIESIRTECRKRNLMIVGHLPFLQVLACRLMSDPQSGDRIRFAQAGMIRLSENDANQWALNQVISPVSLG